MAVHIGCQRVQEHDLRVWPGPSSASGARAGRSARRSTCRTSSASPEARHLTLGEGWKLAAIDAAFDGARPLAWVDDDHDARCVAWAAAREGPTLLVTTDPSVGLTDTHVSALERWAQANGAG